MIPAAPRAGWPIKLLLAAEVVATYTRMRWRLPRVELRELIESLRAGPGGKRSRWTPGSLEERLIVARLANAVNRTLSALPSDSRCLVRSLVLLSMLSARGIDVSLVIGAHSRRGFEAHAWVEYLGRPMLSPEDFSEARLVEI